MLVGSLVLVAAATVAYFSRPDLHTESWAATLSLSSALAVVVGVRSSRTEHPLPWYLLAGAISTFAVGEVADTLVSLVLHQASSFPSVLDGFHLAIYPLAVAAIAQLIRRQAPRTDRAAALDALILFATVGPLILTYLIGPNLLDDAVSWQQQLVSVAYPLGDLLVIAMLFQLVSAGRGSSRSLQMLTVGSAALLVADVTYCRAQLNGTWTGAGWAVDGGWVLFCALVGAAALHPSMAQLSHPMPPSDIPAGRTPMLMIAVVSLAFPLDIVLQEGLGHHQTVLVHAALGSVVIALVVARVMGIARTLRHRLELEKTLLWADAALVAAGDEREVAQVVSAALVRLDSRQIEPGPTLALFDGNGFRGIDTGTQVPLATMSAETVSALTGYGPAIVDRGWVATLVPGSAPSGSVSLVLPLRSSDAVIATLLVMGDIRGLRLLQDAIEAIGFKAAQSLRRIALAQELLQRRSEAHFRSLIQHASDVILVLGSDNEIAYQSPSAATVLGYRESDLAGRTIESLLHKDDITRSVWTFTEMRQQVVLRDVRAQWRLRHADGRWIDAEVVCSNLLADPNVLGLAVTIRDVTRRHEMERELRHRAYHDNLTSLANRGLFADRLEHALRRAARVETPVSLMFIDLDDFKNINDTHGHAVGDQVLRHVARILVASIRAGDTAARLGGDEFALLVEAARSAEEVEMVAGRVLAELQKPLIVKGESLLIRASIGIATSADSNDARELLQLADLALYEAKNLFKGTYRFYRGALRTSAGEAQRPLSPQA